VKAIQYKEYIDGRPGPIVVELRIGADGKGSARLLAKSTASSPLTRQLTPERGRSATVDDLRHCENSCLAVTPVTPPSCHVKVARP
jgi:hypothetical protein